MPDEKVYDQQTLNAIVDDETAPLKTRIVELERDLRHHNTLERNYKIREADQLLLIAYHHSKAGAELAARLNRIIGYMPEDERERAHKLVDSMVASFSIADTLVADSGNNTPHEKGQSSN